jgi:hypothetical protein
MFDTINSSVRDILALNHAPQLVAGYADGTYAWSQADWALFPNSVHVRIAVRWTAVGQVLDVENGDATPAEAVEWCRQTMASTPNNELTVYCNASTWPQVRSAFQNAGVTEPQYWIAEWDNNAVLISGAVAKQYINNPNGLNVDVSVVADHWPGVDAPTPPPPVPVPSPPPNPVRLPVVDLSHVVRAATIDPSAPNGAKTFPADVALVQRALNKLGFEPVIPFLGSFGTYTLHAYASWQAHLGYTGTAQDGVPGMTSLVKLGASSGLFTVVGGTVPPTSTGSHEQAINLMQVTFGQVTDGSTHAAAVEACRFLGVPPTWWVPGIMTAASRESSYAFNAVNTTDLNAHGPIQSDGNPLYCSRGVLQCIPPTFASHHQPGTSNDIYDGVANICAAMNYVMDVYGVARDGHNLASNVQQFDPNRSPRGY